MRYCVVRENPNNGVMSFTRWHETELDAVAEATRLCKKEGKEFIVLSELGICKLQQNPVIYEPSR